MRPTSPALLENMKPIIVEHLGVDPALVTMETDFLDQLGADSLDMMDLAMAFEEKVLVSFEDKEVEKIRTIEDAVKLIEEKQTPSGTLYQKVHTH